jgi:o-succinylbenzoate---CoA ligase
MWIQTRSASLTPPFWKPLEFIESMFLRDAHRMITFDELQDRVIDIHRESAIPGSNEINASDRPADLKAISAHMDLDTAATIATHWLASIPILLLNPQSSPHPPPQPSILTSVLNPQSSLLTTVLNPQPSILLPTSGSTGRPKWVAYTRQQILAAAAASQNAMRPSNGAAWLLNLPLHHAGGLGIILRSLVWRSAVHVSDRKDAEGILRTITDFRDIDTVSLVPTQLYDILDAGGANRLRALKNILIGAGSLSEHDLDIVNRHKLPVRQSYGMTETIGHFCLTERACDTPIAFRSCGHPLPTNELKVVGDDGEALADGHVGHIMIRGVQVISDYAEPDPSKFSDGWFRTGDYGYLSDGELFFVARRTDMIKTGGENVISVRVESAIKELPYVADCAVIGVDDSRWGQRVHACVELGNDTYINLETLRNDLRNALFAFELPRSFSIHDTIPKNSMGKLQRELLIVTDPEIL